MEKVLLQENSKTSLDFKRNMFTENFIEEYKQIDSKFDIDRFESYLYLDYKPNETESKFFKILIALMDSIVWGRGNLSTADRIEVITQNISYLYDSVIDFNPEDIKEVTIDDSIDKRSTKEKFKLYKKAVENNPMLNNLVISFEGIDATGKQTISTLVKEFLMFMDPNHAPVNPEIIKINIPNYNIQSGKEIKAMLDSGSYNTKVLQDLFALNRKEVQNSLCNFNQICEGQANFGWSYGQQVINRNKVTIFDRWTDSAVAFKVAKQLKLVIEHEARRIEELLEKEYKTFDGNLESNLKSLTPYEIEKIIMNTPPLLKYLEEQYNLEHNTLGLVRPDIRILCTSSIDVVEERLSARAKAQNIELDSHEKDLDYLFLVQMVYKFIFKNTDDTIEYLRDLVDKEKLDPIDYIKENLYMHNGNYKGISKVLNTDELDINESVIQVLSMLISPDSIYQKAIYNNSILDYKLLQAGVLDPSEFKPIKRSIYGSEMDYRNEAGILIDAEIFNLFYKADYGVVKLSKEILDFNKTYQARKTTKDKVFESFNTLL